MKGTPPTELAGILEAAQKSFAECASKPELASAHSAHLGKDSPIAAVMKSIGRLPASERADFARWVQQIRGEVQTAFDQRSHDVGELEMAAKIDAETVDVTLPGRTLAQAHSLGSFHPISLTLTRFLSYFREHGYTVVEGPEVEFDALNFDALNIPANHPARDSHDTMYTDQPGLLLRTQTSNMQIRYMRACGVPCRIVAPGRVYRRDFDQTHTPMFHQVEGLVVDTNITFDDLVQTLSSALSAFFERDVPVRLRKNHFPFTEPSAEVDIGCVHCDAKGCKICDDGWIEIMGCGMIHPQVLANCDVDSDVYTGFAFGIGIERLCMLRWNLQDIRQLFENNPAWLRHLPAQLSP